MATTDTASAVDHYAARIDAVLAQRTRLRGPQPAGDLFDGLPPGHPLLSVDPRQPLGENLDAIAGYVESDDIVVGGGAGRMSLPLARRCREVINVDASAARGAAFRRERRQLRYRQRPIHPGRLAGHPPLGTVALVNHVTYFARDIRLFVEKIERAGRRRVIITVNSPPPPSAQRVLFNLLHSEAEEVEPGHAELVNALPDIRVLPRTSAPPPGPFPTPGAAIAGTVARFAPQLATESWAHDCSLIDQAQHHALPHWIDG